jgi:putative transposase
MARLARIAIVNIPHHVTQRGNARQFLLASDNERLVYLELLRRYAQLHELSLLGYCLMSNHVHLIVIPRRADSLALALKHTHGRYASYWNAANQSSGHVWQGRFYSCPLDDDYLWIALRYTELNPVRAHLVPKAESWPWSSAAAHCGISDAGPFLWTESWAKRWSSASWREYLASGEDQVDLCALRKSTHTGRPLGSREFIHSLEQTASRRLAPQKGGRPPAIVRARQQSDLAF